MNLTLVSVHNHKSFTYEGRRLSSIECQYERISYSVIVCMCACSVAKLLFPGPQHARLSAHGILQTRILKGGTISYSRGSFQSRD